MRTATPGGGGGGELTIQAPEYQVGVVDGVGGATVVCSEPLSDPSVSISTDVNHNPPDSSTYECGSIETHYGIEAVGIPDAPSGSIVESVYQITYGGSGTTNLKMHTASLGTSAARTGFRYYFYFPSAHANISDGGACKRAKLTQFSNGSSPSFFSQTEWNPFGGGLSLDTTITHSGGTYNQQQTHDSGTDDIDFTDVKGSWVRYEHYIDATPNQASTTLNGIETYLVDFQNSLESRYSSSGMPLTGVDTQWGTTYTWPINGYVEGSCGSAGRMIAYIMVMQWSSASGQRIPPACEMEPTAEGCP